jgi:hypothetical protein
MDTEERRGCSKNRRGRIKESERRGWNGQRDRDRDAESGGLCHLHCAHVCSHGGVKISQTG